MMGWIRKLGVWEGVSGLCREARYTGYWLCGYASDKAEPHAGCRRKFPSAFKPSGGLVGIACQLSPTVPSIKDNGLRKGLPPNAKAETPSNTPAPPQAVPSGGCRSAIHHRPSDAGHDPIQTKIQRQSLELYDPSTAICQISVNHPVEVGGCSPLSAVVWRFFCVHPAEVGGFGHLSIVVRQIFCLHLVDAQKYLGIHQPLPEDAGRR
ncbi:hypothetical protein B0H12DRAFT_1072841 [Mycena haematopus]|nr:hypothetical protein B0H12DRAFT_1072841 [Mycena haematopus]